jgi:hypothetical protein
MAFEKEENERRLDQVLTEKDVFITSLKNDVASL